MWMGGMKVTEKNEQIFTDIEITFLPQSYCTDES